MTLFYHPVTRKLSSDIVSGQIIASVIVFGFVSMFLLREWISQNARPGVFDDAEVPPEGDLPVADPLPPADERPEEDQLVADPEAFAVQPQEEIAEIPPVAEESQTDAADSSTVSGADIGVVPPVMVRGLPLMDSDVHSQGEARPEDGVRKKARRMYVPGDDRKGKYGKGREDQSPLRPTSPPRRHTWGDPHSASGSSSSLPLDLMPEQTRFTFTQQLQLPQLAQPPPYEDLSSWTLEPSDSESTRVSPPSPISDSTIPPLHIVHGGEPSIPVRRPALPSTSLPSRSQPGTPGSPSGSGRPHSRGHTPLASPTLATYIAPEEFEVGSSRFRTQHGLPDIVDDDSVDETKDEYHRYFGDIQASIDDLQANINDLRASVHDLTEELGIPMAEPMVIQPQLQPPTDDEEEEDEEEVVIPFGDADDEQEDRPPARDAALPRRPPNAAEAEAVDPEEADANLEDDMDGALEGTVENLWYNSSAHWLVVDSNRAAWSHTECNAECRYFNVSRLTPTLTTVIGRSDDFCPLCYHRISCMDTVHDRENYCSFIGA